MLSDPMNKQIKYNSRTFQQQFKFGCALLLSFLVFGCSDNNKVEPTLTSLWDNEFNGCGVICHSPNASDGTELGPDLTTKDNFYNNLVGKNVFNDYPNWASRRVGNCDNVNFITPGNADQSTLTSTLIESYSVSLADSQMCDTTFSVHADIGNDISDKATQDALVEWINNGAQNN
jgi:hypothetical protein